jgi:hypothetical protein
MLNQNIKKLILFLMLGYLNSVFAIPSSHPNTQPLQNSLQRDWNQSILLKSHAAELIITGTGTMRFLQTFYYSDTACSNLLGFGSIIDNAKGYAFTSGQSVSLSSGAAYTLAVNAGITPADIACIRFYVDGGNQEAQGVSCQDFTDITCSGTTCTSQQSKAVNWVDNPTACSTRYSGLISK